MDAPSPEPPTRPATTGPDAPAAPDAAALAGLAGRLRALAHPVRLEVLRTLAARERCLCGQIVEALPLAQSTVSEHLRVLHAAGLVSGRSQGHRSCYGLDKDAMRALKHELDLLFSTLLADPGEGLPQGRLPQEPPPQEAD